MKKSIKKIIATAMSATLVLSSSVLAFADDNVANGNTSGTGSMEGTVSTDVFDVVLPAIPADDTTFNYILDPEGLIEKTESAKYAGKTFEQGATLFFANTATGAAYDYSSTSDSLTVVNKSTMDVDVTLNATISAVDGISMAPDNLFQDSRTSLYLALTDGTSSAAIDGTEGATITAKVDAAPEEAYEYNWNTTENKYEYKIVDDVTNITFSDYSFQLTGACNTNGDWSGLTDAAPVVAVTWTVKEHAAAPSIAETTGKMIAGKATVLNADLGAGDLAATGIKTVSFKTASGKVNAIADTNYSYVNGSLIFTAEYIDSLLSAGVTSRNFTVKFDDAAATTVQITLTLVTEYAPSISQTHVIKTSGSPVDVNVDLGAGELAATGIKSITFTTASGKVTAVTTSSYTFSDGVLSFTTAYIDSLASIESRTFTITFDDAAETTVELTLANS